MADALLRVHFDPRGELAEATRQCEADIFADSFGNSRQQLDEEYERFAAGTVFLGVTDVRGDVVAAARLITPCAAGVKTLEDLAGEPWQVDGLRSAAAAGIDVTRTWDSVTIGARRGLRGAGTLVAAAMWHGLFVSGQVNDVGHITAILDDKVRAMLDSMGLVYRTLPGAWSAPYLGSPSSAPVYCHFPQLLDDQRRLNPEAHRLLTLGIGLDGVAVPEREAFRLRAPVPVVDVREQGHGSVPRQAQHGEVGRGGAAQD